MRKRIAQLQGQDEPKYLTVYQMAALTNLGLNTVRKYAKASGSWRKFGKSARVEKDIFLSYLEEIGTPDSE